MFSLIYPWDLIIKRTQQVVRHYKKRIREEIEEQKKENASNVVYLRGVK